MRTLFSGVFLAALLLAAGTAAAAPPKGYKFVRFEEGMRQAYEQKKPMFVLFGFDGCVHCAIIDRQVFREQDIKEMLSGSYVLVYVDTLGAGETEPIKLISGESITLKQLKTMYQVQGVPAFHFLESNGRPIMNGVGRQYGPGAFKAIHHYIADVHNGGKSRDVWIKEYGAALARAMQAKAEVSEN